MSEDNKNNMSIRTTQDDARENAQIELLKLTPLQGRSNKYIPDGTIEVDGIVEEVELKTSDVVKKQVSTARNVTLPKIKLWKNVWWVFSQYIKTSSGFEFTGEHYAAHGTQLTEWFDLQAEKILGGTKTYGGLRDWETLKGAVLSMQRFHGMPSINEDVISKLDNSFHKKGCGLNDPKIGWKWVERLCTKLDVADPHASLVNLIREGRKNDIHIAFATATRNVA